MDGVRCVLLVQMGGSHMFSDWGRLASGGVRGTLINSMPLVDIAHVFSVLGCLVFSCVRCEIDSSRASRGA